MVTESKAIIILVILFFSWMLLLSEPLIQGQTYNENATVNTTVNITNSAPLISYIYLQDPIVLTAYANTTIFCNVTVYDFDNDTITLNATFFADTVSSGADDDQNNHYSNFSCAQTGRFDTETNFTCGFSVNYFANNGTWYCNATAQDDDNAIGNNQSLSSIVQPLVAIVIPGIIDFGDLAQGAISEDISANITNAGNRDSNVSVKGWGNSEGDNLAMSCTFGNIAIGHERYNTSAESGYADMTQLTQNLVSIPDFYIPQRISEDQESIGSTFWKIQIPVGAGGVCNGKILFSASDRGN